MSDTEILEQDGKIRSLIEQKKYPEALKIANEWVLDEPNSDEAFYARGYANVMWGQFDEAVADLKNAIRIEPSTADYYNFLGVIYEDVGDHEAAYGEYSRALHIEPDNLEYNSNVCKAKMQLGEIDDAMTQVEGMFRTNKDNDVIRENLAGVYSIAAFKDWHYVEEDGKHYATTHEHINVAEKYCAKARALAVSGSKVLARLEELDISIKESKKRKFTGGWGALAIALFFSFFMFQNKELIALVYGVCAVLYYYSLRTPQYVMNHIAFTGKDELSLGDRIASVLVCDGWIFFGATYGDAIMAQAKTNLFFAVLRTSVRLVLLPVTVVTALFKNYSMNHALLTVAGMLTVSLVLAFI